MFTPLLIAGTLAAGSLLAQTPARTSAEPIQAAAAAAITAADVARQLGALAADSLRWRGAPSPALDRTAKYVATEFKRLGLQPGMGGAEEQGWFQRYDIPGQKRVNGAQSSVGFIVRLLQRDQPVVDDSGVPVRKTVVLSFGTTAYFAPEIGRQVISRPPFDQAIFGGRDPFGFGQGLAVVAGPQTAASVRQAADVIRDKVVLYIPSAGVDSAVRREVVTALYAASQGVMVISGDDSAQFAAAHAAQQPPPVEFVDTYLRSAVGPRQWPWAAVVWAPPVREMLATVGENLTRLRTESTPVVRALPPSVVALLDMMGETMVTDIATAPNVVAVVEGSDPALQHECVVISAHMDNADDDASGVAGLAAIARAFSQPDARPRRSLVFLATSGGTKEYWGANYFAEHLAMLVVHKPVIVANLTLDKIGYSAGDSLWVDGPQDVELPLSPEWAAMAHPELDLRVMDGGSAVRPRSDHFAFVRTAVPSLYFHVDHADQADARTWIAADNVVRVARLVFYVAHAIADADRVPRWSPVGRQQLRSVLVP